eukprot:TRINITY_DN7292_c0_g1_i1.p1 TRINITY_DN7292_c0_g1~~TRINITY_DN7292_c0_g1_i1.p1  ORF type:complete len:1573 (+),score=267.99 TRINITY_DN7292_c0_g1_i1:77-4795(+)
MTEEEEGCCATGKEGARAPVLPVVSQHHAGELGCLADGFATALPCTNYARRTRSKLPPRLLRPWEHAVYGTVKQLVLPPLQPVRVRDAPLGQLCATAIAGNDLTSSIMFTCGIAIKTGGIFAPISMLFVALTMHFYRGIYDELGTLLPFNGGAYNALLNATRKHLAGLVAGLAILAYLSTVLVSADAGVEYLADFPVPWLATETGGYVAVILVLVLVTMLNLLGLTESARVSTVFFLVHLATLGILIVASATYCIVDRAQTLKANLNSWSTSKVGNPPGSAASNIFFGYCASLLGVTGFETSCNFIEEQRPGVYHKTLRNLWWLILLNPVITLLCLFVVPLEQISGREHHLLSYMGKIVAGEWLRKLIVVDAFCVLFGTVLTCFVGVNGLLTRMTTDRMMPAFMLHRNRFRKTQHWAIIGFFVLNVSLWLLSQNLATLAGVFDVSFLSVLAGMALANGIMKYNRDALRRNKQEPWLGVAIGFVMVVIGLIGTVINAPIVLGYFAIFFSFVLVILFLMFNRVPLLNLLLGVVLQYPSLKKQLRAPLEYLYQRARNRPLVFFTKTANVAILNKVALYCLANEDTDTLTFVHLAEKDDPAFNQSLVAAVQHIDDSYPKLRSNLLFAQGKFGPEVIPPLSEFLATPPNFMFMACPSKGFPHDLKAFGGVRVITYNLDSLTDWNPKGGAAGPMGPHSRSTLCFDVVDLAFHYLDSDSLNVCCRVCMEWRQLVWRGPTLDDPVTRGPRTVLSRVLCVGPRYVVYEKPPVAPCPVRAFGFLRWGHVAVAAVTPQHTLREMHCIGRPTVRVTAHHRVHGAAVGGAGGQEVVALLRPTPRFHLHFVDISSPTASVVGSVTVDLALDAPPCEAKVLQHFGAPLVLVATETLAIYAFEPDGARLRFHCASPLTAPGLALVRPLAPGAGSGVRDLPLPPTTINLRAFSAGTILMATCGGTYAATSPAGTGEGHAGWCALSLSAEYNPDAEMSVTVRAGVVRFRFRPRDDFSAADATSDALFSEPELVNGEIPAFPLVQGTSSYYSHFDAAGSAADAVGTGTGTGTGTGGGIPPPSNRRRRDRDMYGVVCETTDGYFPVALPSPFAQSAGNSNNGNGNHGQPLASARPIPAVARLCGTRVAVALIARNEIGVVRAAVTPRHAAASPGGATPVGESHAHSPFELETGDDARSTAATTGHHQPWLGVTDEQSTRISEIGGRVMTVELDQRILHALVLSRSGELTLRSWSFGAYRATLVQLVTLASWQRHGLPQPQHAAVRVRLHTLLGQGSGAKAVSTPSCVELLPLKKLDQSEQPFLPPPPAAGNLAGAIRFVRRHSQELWALWVLLVVVCDFTFALRHLGKRGAAYVPLSIAKLSMVFFAWTPSERQLPSLFPRLVWVGFVSLGLPIVAQSGKTAVDLHFALTGCVVVLSGVRLLREESLSLSRRVRVRLGMANAALDVLLIVPFHLPRLLPPLVVTCVPAACAAITIISSALAYRYPGYRFDLPAQMLLTVERLLLLLSGTFLVYRGKPLLFITLTTYVLWVVGETARARVRRSLLCEHVRPGLLYLITFLWVTLPLLVIELWL